MFVSAISFASHSIAACRPLCCLLSKFLILKQRLSSKFQLLVVLIAYEYSKCLSLPVSFASHCIGCCCLQATLLSFAQFLFCFSKDIYIECSIQFKWKSYFYVSGQRWLFWAALNCSKIQIWNLNRLTHIQFNEWGRV